MSKLVEELRNSASNYVLKNKVKVSFVKSELLHEAVAHIERLNEERQNWLDCAAMMSRNADFYQGIVRQIGEMFGEEARTSDDGSVQSDVLTLKVPELVEQLIKATQQADKGE